MPENLPDAKRCCLPARPASRRWTGGRAGLRWALCGCVWLYAAALGASPPPAPGDGGDQPSSTTLAYRPERVAMLNASATRLARSEPARARAMAEDALRAASAAHDEVGRIEALHNLGRIARLLGDLRLALERLRQAETAAEQFGDQRLLAKVSNNLAVTYALLGLDVEALELNQRVQSMWLALDDQAGEIASIINIGRVFEQRGEIDQARSQFERAGQRVAAAAAPEAIVAQDRAAIHIGLARVALRAGEPAQALSEIERALAIQRPAGDRIGEAAALVVRAAALAQSGLTERARDSYDQALALATRLDDRTTMAEVHAELAASYWRMYQEQRGQAEAGDTGLLDDALRHSVSALALARPGTPRQWLPIYRLQAAIHEAKGDLAAAVAVQKTLINTRDRWMAEQDEARYALLASRFQVKQREQEIARLQTQSQLSAKLIQRERASRWLLLVAVALALLWLLALGLRYRERVRSSEHLRVAGDSLRLALDEAERARAQAERADRFKTEMLGMAAHDLRNPLSSIQGFAELIESGRAQTTDETRRFARIIANASRRALALLGDLLESAALDAGRVELHPIALDLNTLLVEVIERVRPRADAKSQPIELLGASDAIVRGDPDRLAQVFENLLGNAIKFSPPQGRIEVRIAVGADEVSVDVRDFGQGFASEEKSRLFQRFQRLSARPTAGESSTGLGLAIVRDLVQLHEGRVEAESAGSNLGANFRVILPRLCTAIRIGPLDTDHQDAEPVASCERRA
ncbi:MAG: ATP-binding protein [Lysobacterales bacterium]